jgi:putative transposase
VLASCNEQPVQIFQQFAGGHPPGRDDVRAIPLSLGNVEDLLAEPGIDISHETVRFWWNRFGSIFAAEIRKRRVRNMRGYPQWRWHLDEVFVRVNGKLCYLWRAVDHEGEVLEGGRHDEAGPACGAEASQADDRHRRAACLFRGDEGDRLRRSTQGRGRLNHRAENSHQPFRRRERAMQRFRSLKTLQKFTSVHTQVHNQFNQERHLVTRQD